MASALSLYIDAAAEGANKSTPVILIMGDSLSAAYGIDVSQGWVALLEQRLQSQGYGYRVVNASISGETSGGLLARVPKLLELNHPTIVIVEIGANDGLRGLPVKQAKENVTTIVKHAQQAGAQVVLLGMQMPPNYGARYTQDFAAMFGEIAHQQHAVLVPFFLEGIALDRSLVQADGLHPTATAQPRLLNNVWPSVKPLLKKKN